MMGDNPVPSYLATAPLLKGCPTIAEYAAKNPPPAKAGEAVIAELENVVKENYVTSGTLPGYTPRPSSSPT